MVNTSKHQVFLAYLVFTLTACGSAPEAPGQDVEPVEPVAHTYRSAGGQELQAYVFTPPSRDSVARPASAILLFHGGGWVAGTPEWTFRAARRFADHGLVAISVQYRLSNDEVTPIDALDDVCAAFSWARNHAAELGLDPERVAGYGVSAGGHLVTAAATVGCPTNEATSARSDPDALLLWSPALDMTRDGWFRRKLQDRAPAEDYSPVDNVRSSTPATSIVQGGADTLTPLSGAKRYCERLTAAGKTCDLHVYEGLGHLLSRNLENQEDDFDPDPDAVADGIEEHLQFLRDHGFSSARKSR